MIFKIMSILKVFFTIILVVFLVPFSTMAETNSGGNPIAVFGSLIGLFGLIFLLNTVLSNNQKSSSTPADRGSKNILCLITGHTFSGGCVCYRCRFEKHSWEGCKCSKCDKLRDEMHDWQRNVCKICGKERVKYDSNLFPRKSSQINNFKTIVCKDCGSTINKSPMRGTNIMLYEAVICTKCGKIECIKCKNRYGSLQLPCSDCGNPVSPAFEDMLHNG